MSPPVHLTRAHELAHGSPDSQFALLVQCVPFVAVYRSVKAETARMEGFIKNMEAALDKQRW